MNVELESPLDHYSSVSPEKTTRLSTVGSFSNQKSDDLAGSIITPVKVASKSENFRISNSMILNKKVSIRLKDSEMTSANATVAPFHESHITTGYCINSDQRSVQTERRATKNDQPLITNSVRQLPKKPSMTAMILKALQKDPAHLIQSREDSDHDSRIVGLRRK
jgi:hypothetical protein